MFLLTKNLKFPKDNFLSMKFMPYRLKPSFSAKRIKEWHDYWDGRIYISFSGGLDSTILAHLVCETYRKYRLSGSVILVFSDTGLEYPEIRDFVPKYVEWLKAQFPELDIRLDTIRPKKSFRWVCENAGFPLISKDTAGKIRKLRHGNLCPRYRNYLLRGDERGKFGMLAKKWQYLSNPQVIKEDISDKCCDILKKEPFRRYVREHKRYPLIGITQDEGFRRENQYNHTGCNVYDGKTIKGQPLGFWMKQDVLQYAVENMIPICSIYGSIIQNLQGIYILTGEQRTGCILCGFGCHLEQEPNRFQRLAVSSNIKHRVLYEHGLAIKNNGVTYKEALGHCGIPVETWRQQGQMDLFQDYFIQETSCNEIKKCS